MYINYINDRQELGFSCIKDIDAIKQLSNLKSTLKNPVSWVIRKGKQTVVLIFSKEVLVAVFIFLESMYLKPTVDCRSFTSYEVYQSCLIKSESSGFLTSSSRIEDYILKSRGGSEELTSEEQEILVKSILSKAPESSYSEISVNKFLKKILKLIDPVISDQRFWRILGEFGKPIKSELPGPSEVRSTNILGPYEPDKQAKTGSRSSSSIFVEGFFTPTTLSPMQKRVQRNRALILTKKEPTLTPTMLKASQVPYNYDDVMKKLEEQSSKNKIDIQVGDQIYMIKNPYSQSADELQFVLAEKVYDSIRESDTDISDIASILEFKADNIKNIKDHVFYNEHDLDRYGPNEIEHKRFDATLEQALSWKRLEAGTHTQDDVTWIKHECAERHHELKYGSGYSEAHERAQSRYDGYPWENKF